MLSAASMRHLRCQIMRATSSGSSTMGCTIAAGVLRDRHGPLRGMDRVAWACWAAGGARAYPLAIAGELTTPAAPCAWCSPAAGWLGALSSLRRQTAAGCVRECACGQCAPGATCDKNARAPIGVHLRLHLSHVVGKSSPALWRRHQVRFSRFSCDEVCIHSTFITP